MPTAIVITLPKDEDQLREEVEERLGQDANVYPAPAAYPIGLDEVKLIVEIAAGGLTIVKMLLEIKQMYVERGEPTNVKIEKPGTGSVSLDEADEAMLRQLLGVDG